LQAVNERAPAKSGVPAPAPLGGTWRARNIGDSGEVLALAVEAGLDEKEAAEVITGDAYRERVLASTAQAQSIGITGIPAFLLERQFLVLGAQPRGVFEQALAQLGKQGPTD
jgi:predicted DsbA family dithiol-disulfide isomerase